MDNPEFDYITIPEFADTRLVKTKQKASFTDEEKVLVATHLNTVGGYEGDIDSQTSVFSDWQSDKTKTSKRLSLTVSIAVFAAALLGSSVGSISIFGIKAANSDSKAFTIFVLVTMLVSTAYFYFAYTLDVKVRDMKLRQFRDEGKSVITAVRELKIIFASLGVYSHDSYIRVFKKLDKSHAVPNPDTFLTGWKNMIDYQHVVYIWEAKFNRLRLAELFCIYFLTFLASIPLLVEIIFG